MITKVGVIYSLSQLVPRIVFEFTYDDTEAEKYKNNIRSGEGWLDVPIEYYDGAEGSIFRGYISSQIGDPQSDRCAVIYGDGEVITILHADPVIDDHPGGFVIQDNIAMPGDTYDFETGQVIK